MSNLNGTVSRWQGSQPGVYNNAPTRSNTEYLTLKSAVDLTTSKISQSNTRLAALEGDTADRTITTNIGLLAGSPVSITAAPTPVMFTGTDSSWLQWHKAGDASCAITEPGIYIVGHKARITYDSCTNVDVTVRFNTFQTMKISVPHVDAAAGAYQESHYTAVDLTDVSRLPCNIYVTYNATAANAETSTDTTQRLWITRVV